MVILAFSTSDIHLIFELHVDGHSFIDRMKAMPISMLVWIHIYAENTNELRYSLWQSVVNDAASRTHNQNTSRQQKQATTGARYSIPFGGWSRTPAHFVSASICICVLHCDMCVNEYQRKARHGDNSDFSKSLSDVNEFFFFNVAILSSILSQRWCCLRQSFAIYTPICFSFDMMSFRSSGSFLRLGV